MAKRKSTVVSDSPSKRLRDSSGGKTTLELPTETPEKRGRGRPRKNQEVSPSLQAPSEIETPKRGRGRPLKIAAATQSSAKKGPGRPAKTDTAKKVSPRKVGRGRGRPHKETPVETTESSDSSDAKPNHVDSDLEFKAPSRGRGRPSKSTAKVTAASRGRGRPRKASPVDETDVTSDSSNIKSEADCAESEKSVRGRGRPSKNTAKSASASRGRPRKSITTLTKELGEPAPAIEATTGATEAEDAIEPAAVTAEQPREPSQKPALSPSYWLMKAEPESRIEKGADVKFSIDDLAAAKVPEPWDGVRNPAARNLMRQMKKGDYAFFYHSNCKVPGVVGIMEIVNEHSVDESAFDPLHPYYDTKSTRGVDKWVVVHVEFRHKLQKQVTLNELKSHFQPGQALENLQTLKQSRLSVSSVSPAQWRFIIELAGEDPSELMKEIAKTNV